MKKKLHRLLTRQMGPPMLFQLSCISDLLSVASMWIQADQGCEHVVKLDKTTPNSMSIFLEQLVVRYEVASSTLRPDRPLIGSHTQPPAYRWRGGRGFKVRLFSFSLFFFFHFLFVYASCAIDGEEGFW
ncbi:hypothetical protein BP00DRAFT_199246 [Aspergillus indologenus CBS 114.80]|uniref:Uncharacterized protein n=1 Tax=Aspergillus indologenus CBS 114.80 TaxID=1450541 RepID=A0A2V5I1H9_9EURO|nr:hypothetical protein BP00DRAFT_199246 [Aspergillus indologenus CBS 114.80]